MTDPAPLTRPKLSSPPEHMTPEEVIQELAAALRDVIAETDESYLKKDPEDAYTDLACRLVFKMRSITVVPVRSKPLDAETRIQRSYANGALRIFEILSRWLKEHPRALETGVNDKGRFEVTLTELVANGYEVKGFFQGESVQDAYAQAAQTLEFNGGDL